MYAVPGGKYENFYWTLDDTGTLTISGSNISSFHVDSPPWSSYVEQIKRIVVSEGVTSLGNYCFRCPYAEEIYLPDSLTTMPVDAFYGLESIRHISIPPKVKTIQGWNFYNCYKLESIYIPKSIEKISTWAFYHCSNLKTIYYEGTEDDWENIKIEDTTLNEGLQSETIKIFYNGQTSVENMYEYLVKYYPEYLNNNAVNNYLATCNNIAYQCIESYSDTSLNLKAYSEAFVNGADIIIKQIFADLGWGDSLEDEWRDKNAVQLVKKFSENEALYYKAWERVCETYKNCKLEYKGYSTVKDVLDNYVDSIAKYNNIEEAEIKKYLNEAFALSDEWWSGKLFDTSSSAVVDFLDITFFTLQLYDVEVEKLNIILENVPETSELYQSIYKAKNEMLASPAEYILDRFMSKANVALTKELLESFSKVAGETIVVTTDLFKNLSVCHSVINFTSKLLYESIPMVKIDKIYGAVIAYNYYISMDTATTSLLTKLMLCKNEGEIPNEELIENYKILYNLRNIALENYVDACISINTNETLTQILNHIKAGVKKDSGYITFDKYIRMCEETYRYDCLNEIVSCNHEISTPQRVIVGNCLTPERTQFRCNVCFKEYISTTAEAPGHDYITKNYPVTCEEEGYTLTTCSRCSLNRKTDIIPETGHTYNDSSYICQSCGYVNDIVPVKGAFENILSIRKYITEESVIFKVDCTDNSIDINNFNLYTCEYENDSLSSVVIGEKYIEDNTITLKAKISKLNNYRIFLWHNMTPVIDSFCNH